MAAQSLAAASSLFNVDDNNKKRAVVNPPPRIGSLKVDSVMTNDDDDDTAAAGVRTLRLDEYKEAAHSLAEAFADDHVSRYFVDVPDRPEWTEARKWELHVRIMEYLTYAHLLKGKVVACGPGYECVALWMPPGQNIDDKFTLLRSGLWRLNYQLSPEGRHRFFNEFFPLLHDTKASVLGPRDPHSWYLVYIGTRASGRGKGYAKKAINSVLEVCDSEGRAAYLESSAAVNRGIYGRMGFEVCREICLERAEERVMMDIMVREPKGRKDGDGEGGLNH